MQRAQRTLQSTRSGAKELGGFRFALTCPWRTHGRCDRSSCPGCSRTPIPLLLYRAASWRAPREPKIRVHLVDQQNKGACCSSETKPHRSPSMRSSASLQEAPAKWTRRTQSHIFSKSRFSIGEACETATPDSLAIANMCADIAPQTRSVEVFWQAARRLALLLERRLRDRGG